MTSSGSGDAGAGFRYGIEHEMALQHADGRFADHRSVSYAELEAVLDRLPGGPEAVADLHVDAEGIKSRRWYVEGFERFGPDGGLQRYEPKGVEVRTLIHPTIDAAVAALRTDVDALDAELARVGLRTVVIGFHPERTEYVVDPPLNDWERRHRARSPEERTEHLHMSTFGPDLNLSSAALSPDELLDVGRKLTHYSPWLVPFSFSSPFRDGAAWGGLSARTFFRTGRRPAVLVHLDADHPLPASDPSLAKHARIPAEVGRIEVKAFDACPDLGLYGELLSLLTGLVLDRTLPGRRTTPDAAAHQHVARDGLRDDATHAATGELLTAATAALAGRPDDLRRMAALHGRWERRESPAEAMLAAGLPRLGEPGAQ